MATGILGNASLLATTNTTVYEVPADTFSVVTINVANRSDQERRIRVALAATDTPTDAEYIEYDAQLIGNGVLERGGVVVDAGKKIVAYSNSTDVSVVVFGIETSTI